MTKVTSVKPSKVNSRFVTTAVLETKFKQESKSQSNAISVRITQLLEHVLQFKSVHVGETENGCMNLPMLNGDREVK